MRYLEKRHQSDMRVSTVVGAIHRALVQCIGADPDLTEEELLEALIAVATRKTQRLRNGQRTPVAGVAGEVPKAWVNAFNEATAAVGCGVCGRTTPCRCLVPPERRPDKTAAGLAAVLPLIMDALNDKVDTDAHG